MASRRALPGVAGVEVAAHLLDEPLDRRGLVPQHDLAPRVALEVGDRAVVVVEGGVVQRQHQRVEITNAAELVEDPGQRGPVHLGGHEGDDERNREARRERLHAPLHLVHVPRHQEGDGGDRSELVEVAHGHLPGGLPAGVRDPDGPSACEGTTDDYETGYQPRLTGSSHRLSW
jgi:hypothetical protein